MTPLSRNASSALKEIRMETHNREGNERIRVKGHFNVGAHLLPFNYDCAATDHMDHGAHLEEHYRRAQGWASKTAELSPWIGTEETVGPVSITVLHAHVMAVSFSDWPVYFSWEEKDGAKTELHELKLAYRNPDDIPTLETLQGKVRASILARHVASPAKAEHVNQIAALARGIA